MREYPKWSELPEIDLYLDQVLEYVNKLHSPIMLKNDKGLTSAMINNYVKNHYMDKPIKKKYSRRQLARLIVITYLKNVFSIQEISKTLTILTENDKSEIMYNNFVACMNGEDTDEIPIVIKSACATVKLYEQTLELADELKSYNNR